MAKSEKQQNNVTTQESFNQKCQNTFNVKKNNLNVLQYIFKIK